MSVDLTKESRMLVIPCQSDKGKITILIALCDKSIERIKEYDAAELVLRDLPQCEPYHGMQIERLVVGYYTAEDLKKLSELRAKGSTMYEVMKWMMRGNQIRDDMHDNSPLVEVMNPDGQWTTMDKTKVTPQKPRGVPDRHKRPFPPLDKFKIVEKWQLEDMGQGTCACCNEKFSDEHPVEMTSRCHQGPMYIAYREGWLLTLCGVCRAPVGRIPVSADLV